MSKSLNKHHPNEREQVAQRRLKMCYKGKDKDGYGLSGLGYWAAYDYLNYKNKLK